MNLLYLLNFLKAFSDLLRIYHKANLNFTSITITLITVSLIQPLIVYYAVNEFFYVGFLWSRVFLFGFSSLLFIVLLKKFPKFVFKLEFDYLKKMFVIGLPIVLFGLMMTVLITIDKFYIKANLGAKTLGYYSIGALIFQVILVLPQSIYGSYFPKFIVYTGNQTKLIDKLSTLIKLIIIPVIFVCWIAIPIFIKLLLPEYVQGIQSAKILTLSAYFAASYQMYYYEIIRRNKFKRLIIGSVLILIFSLTLYTLANNFVNTIDQYAFVNVIVFCVFSLSIISIAIVEMNKPFKVIVRQLIFDLFKIYPLIAVLIIDYLLAYSLKAELLKIIVFIILFIPYVLINKKIILSFTSKNLFNDK